MDFDTQISLYGAKGTGKTAWIAVLKEAAQRSRVGRWQVHGALPPDDGFLDSAYEMLTRLKRFLPGTVSVQHYSFVVVPMPHEGILAQAGEEVSRVWGRGRTGFRLHFVDGPGEAFLEPEDPGAGESVWLNIRTSRGIVYLFDPTIEAPDGSQPPANYRYLRRLSQETYRKLAEEGRLVDGRYFPHFVAVCLTKLDNPAVFSRLDERGLLSRDERGYYVKDGDAERAFREFADRDTVDALEGMFVKSRLRYYVTSSIGFYHFTNPMTKAEEWDPRDCVNVVHLPNGERIRGGVSPINVFEPLVEIYRSVIEQAAQEQKRRPGGG